MYQQTGCSLSVLAFSGPRFTWPKPLVGKSTGILSIKNMKLFEHIS